MMLIESCYNLLIVQETFRGLHFVYAVFQNVRITIYGVMLSQVYKCKSDFYNLGIGIREIHKEHNNDII